MKCIVWIWVMMAGIVLPVFAQDNTTDLTQFKDSSSIVKPPYGVYQWDMDITKAVNTLEFPYIDHFSSVMSGSLLPVGAGVPLAMVAAGNMGVSLDPYQNRYLAETGVLSVTAEAGTVLIVIGLKALTTRERPYIASPKEFIGRADEILSSFPSGHAAVSAAFATMVSLQYPRWYVIVPSALWSLSVSFSRMYLGMHYFSDVVAGTLVGTGIALAVHSLRKQILPSYNFLLPPEPPSAQAQQATSIQFTHSLGVKLLPDGAAMNFSVPILSR